MKRLTPDNTCSNMLLSTNNSDGIHDLNTGLNRFSRTIVFIFFAFCWLMKIASATPFPVNGEIYDANNQRIGTAHVYPRYVEIFDNQNRMVGKVGILVEKGIAKLFLVSEIDKYRLVGYASQGLIFDDKDAVRGHYFWTPTWSFVYQKDGKRAGKVKCIAWPRVCAVGVGGFLLNLFSGGNNEKSP